MKEPKNSYKQWTKAEEDKVYEVLSKATTSAQVSAGISNLSKELNRSKGAIYQRWYYYIHPDTDRSTQPTQRSLNKPALQTKGEDEVVYRAMTGLWSALSHEQKSRFMTEEILGQSEK